MRKLKNELQEIEEEAVFFAQDNGVSILYGKEFSLHVTEQETIQYPSATDPRRKELEVISQKIWHLGKRLGYASRKAKEVFAG